MQINVRSVFSSIAAFQEHGEGHTVLELGQCFGVVVVVWTICCFAGRKWERREVNVKERRNLYVSSLRSGKLLLSH